jgi:hypothetical protein
MRTKASPYVILNFSVSLTTPVKPRRSQSQSVAVILPVHLSSQSQSQRYARIPIAPLENAVKVLLEDGRKVSGWTERESSSVKVSQTSLEKG